MSGSGGSSTFDLTTATSSLSNLPTSLQHDVPTMAVMTGFNLLAESFHSYARNQGYMGSLTLAMINGIVDTMKFDYWYGIGGKPANY